METYENENGYVVWPHGEATMDLARATAIAETTSIEIGGYARVESCDTNETIIAFRRGVEV